jgi:hypothetical protein
MQDIEPKPFDPTCLNFCLVFASADVVAASFSAFLDTLMQIDEYSDSGNLYVTLTFVPFSTGRREAH